MTRARVVTFTFVNHVSGWHRGSPDKYITDYACMHLVVMVIARAGTLGWSNISVTLLYILMLPLFSP